MNETEAAISRAQKEYDPGVMGRVAMLERQVRDDRRLLLESAEVMAELSEVVRGLAEQVTSLTRLAGQGGVIAALLSKPPR